MNFSKNILFLESSRNIGGQELQLLQQMQELNLLGWSARLLCKYDSRIYDYALSLGLDVKKVGFKNALHLPSIFFVIGQIRQLKPRILICHSGHDAVIASIAAKLVGMFRVRPKVIRMRTYQPKAPSSFPYNYLFDMTYTPSEHLREKILKNKKIKQSKIGVLYPGINFKKLDEVSDELNQDLMVWLERHPGPIVAHGAMLRGEKGHATIIQALPEIIRAIPDVRYVIAGEGVEKDTLEEMVAKLSLQEHVYFAGMVQPISSLLKVSSLAILPSLMEPLGMFQIESQYSGIPTMASNVDGIPETLVHEKTGLLVQAGNSVEWSQKIIWALNHLPRMQAWAKQGHLFVVDKFSMAKNTQELIKLIQG